MYKILENYFEHKDERGEIKGIINSGEWREANFVSSKKGTTRGGHYHKNTKELFYILEGKIKASLQNTETKERAEFTLEEGKICIIEPNTIHSFKILENSKWINMLSMPMDKNNPDIY